MIGSPARDQGTAPVVEGSWPVLTHERVWSPFQLFTVITVLAIATWVFPIGGVIAGYLPVGIGFAALFAGTAVATFVVVLATTPVSTKYGIDAITSTKPQLGTRGCWIALVLQVVSVIGWNSVLVILLANAGAEILVTLGLAGEGARGTLEVMFGLGAVAAVWLVLRGGTRSLGAVAPYVATGVLILATYILVLLIAEIGWPAIRDAAPATASGDQLHDFYIGFDLALAAQLSFWPYMGAVVRMTRGARRAVWPAMLGLALPITYIGTIGLFSGLAIPDSVGDPTTFLVDVGGPQAGILALTFILFGNIGTVSVGIFVLTIGVRQLPPIQRRLSWNGSTALALLPVAVIATVFADSFYANVGTFLAFLGVLFAPLCGVQIVDYFVLRRQRLAIDGLFTGEGGGPYHYLGGFNVVGLIALGAGFVVYLLLLNPFTLESRGIYGIVSAGVPAGVVAAIVYGMGMWRAVPRVAEATTLSKSLPSNASAPLSRTEGR